MSPSRSCWWHDCSWCRSRCCERWDTSGMEHPIEIAGDMIRLGQLLKLAGIASVGADAKGLIAGGQVIVNGEPELRRGRQLHPGDIVRGGTADLRIAAA